MKRIFILPLCTLLLAMSLMPASRAQSSEFGAMFGTSFYLGDLNQSGVFINHDRTGHYEFCPAGGFMYRYNISPRWALKADFIFAKVCASDVATLNAARNLSFTSPITELSVEAELNFLKLYNAPQKNRFSPYIFAGITVFSFNPQAQLVDGGEFYELQSLGTEGQELTDESEKRYSLTSVAIPFGIGLKFTIGRHFSIGAEWGMRYTFTDYLDDVKGVYCDNQVLRDARGSIVADLADRSPELGTEDHPIEFNKEGTQRGNVTTTDLYSFAGITFTVKFGNESKTCDLHKPRKPLH